MKDRFRLGRGVAEGLIVLGVILITISATLLKGTPAQEALMYVSLALLVAALVVVFFLCRCPGCGQVVFKNLIGAKICPDCGRPLWPGARAGGGSSDRLSSQAARSKKRR